MSRCRVAFRANQATVKAAKAAAGPSTGPKRGFPGRAKNAAAATPGESELLDEQVGGEPAGDDEENLRIGHDGQDEEDGEDMEDDDEDEVDQELLDAIPGSDDEPIEEDAEMS